MPGGGGVFKLRFDRYISFEMVLFAINCLFKIRIVIKMSNELYPELKQTKQDFILSSTITVTK